MSIKKNKCELENWLRKTVAICLNISEHDVDIDAPFLSLGIRSKKTFTLAKLIGDYLSIDISPTILFEYPTISLLSDFLSIANEKSNHKVVKSEEPIGIEPIAIIGMSCRAPGANNIGEYWELLNNKKNTVNSIPEKRWDNTLYYDSDPMKPGKLSTKNAGFIDNIKQFDNNLFKLSNAELLDVDPQQRVLLEVAWETLETACYVPNNMRDKNVGVFVGLHSNDYLRMNLAQPKDISAYTIPGGALSVAAGRISYQFGFIGPAIAIDTACSSSLMSVHLACQSLYLNECEMALAGGVNLILSPDFLVGLTKSRILSPSGQCHTFDSKADGYARSEGCGLVLVKRLSRAIKDKDNILAVILSSSANQNGFSNGLIAPSKSAQISVIKSAIRKAKIKPHEIDYIEAHGSGTVLGDMIELESLNNVFSEDAELRKDKLVVGSAKTNIGHTETAAGILGLIKVVLAQRHKRIPANYGLEELNPHINWETFNLNVVKETIFWDCYVKKQRLAGVSSFGFSGANVHMIIQEHQDNHELISSKVDEYHLMLSAADPKSVETIARTYARFLLDKPSININDFCYVVNHCRAKLDYNICISANSKAELIEKLSDTSLIRCNLSFDNNVTIEPTHGNKRIIPTYAFSRKNYWKAFEKVIHDNKENEETVVNTQLEPKKYTRVLLAKLLKIHQEDINDQTPLLSYGFDSIMGINLKNELHKNFNVDIPLQIILSLTNASNLTNLIKERCYDGESKRNVVIKKYLRNKQYYPLSPPQKQLIFLQQMASDSPAFLLPIALNLVGELDLVALEKSINQLRNDHEILRTNFVIRDGVPQQIINAYKPTSPQFHDLSLLGHEERAHSASMLLKSLSSQVPCLRKDDLFHVHVIKIAEKNYKLALIFHHIIMDGWSLIDILIPKIIDAYQQYCKYGKIDTVKQKLEYIDYCEWLVNTHDNSFFEKDINYWKEKLSGATFTRVLETDYLRPDRSAFRGKRSEFMLRKDLGFKLKTYAEKTNNRLFSILLSTLYLVIYKWTGMTDIIIGTTFSSRENAQLHTVIGDFTNHLPLRICVDDEQHISAFILKVSETVLDAQQHSLCPSQIIVEAIKPEQRGNRNPLFNIACVMQSFLANTSSWKFSNQLMANLETTTGQIDNGTSEMDLIIEFIVMNDVLIIEYEYDTQLYCKETMHSFLNHFQALLSQVVDNGDVVISETTHVSSIPTPHTINNEIDTANLLTVPRLLANQASLQPNATALIYQDKALSYQELDKRSNILANSIIDTIGLQKGIIGLYVDRTFNCVIAALAVLKTGNAYLFLDHGYPISHIQSILHDAQVILIVYEESLSNNEQVIKGRQRLSIDAINFTDSAIDVAPTAKYSLNDTAYVIYTSGSTGKPKGIAVSHKNLSRLFQTTQTLFNFRSDDTWVLYHSCSFDFSVWEMWGGLVHGGRLVILPYLMTRQPKALYNVLIKHNVSVLNQTPSAFSQFCQYYQTLERCTDFKLRYIIFGGEKLALTALQPWIMRHQFDNPQLINMYGITEITVHATFHRIDAISGDHLFQCNIGNPLPDLNIFICDKYQQPLPIGAVGELYIAGPGVTKGYLSCSEKDKNKFLSGLSNITEQPVYRTGDLGRRLHTGEIQYFGRIDNQIKLRGFRIELEHIRSLINANDTINDSVITKYGTNKSNQSLVAYLVPDMNKARHQYNSNTSVCQWESVFNTVYKHVLEHNVYHFNHIGWNDSYTSLSLPKDDMQVWLQSSLDSISLLKPRHVLEIGCGTGMLLFNLLDKVETYTATDLSRSAIEYVREHLASLECKHNKVFLYQQDALNFKNLVKKKYDVIILNSVIQYFPSLDYLKNLLFHLSDYIAEGGYLYLGDIRDFRSIDLFNASLAFYKSSENANISEINGVADRIALAETELLVSPAFFYHLANDTSRIAQVRTSLRKGRQHNEMLKYRYDIVIRFDMKISSYSHIDNCITCNRGTALSDIELYLKSGALNSILFKAIPNNRLVKDASIYNALVNKASKFATKEILENQLGNELWIEPEDLVSLANKYNYRVNISNAFSEKIEFIDCYMVKSEVLDEKIVVMPSCNSVINENNISNYVPFKSLSDYLKNATKSHLQALLPTYMLPSYYMVLKKFPLTINGKLDVKKLPNPSEPPPDEKTYIKPRNKIEKLVVNTLSQLVTVSTPSVSSKFFEIGGNSILATQLIAKIKENFGLDIPLAMLLSNPTIEEISSVLMSQIAEAMN